MNSKHDEEQRWDEASQADSTFLVHFDEMYIGRAGKSDSCLEEVNLYKHGESAFWLKFE